MVLLWWPLGSLPRFRSASLSGLFSWFYSFNLPRSAAITDLLPLLATPWQELGYPPFSERGAELHPTAATLCCKAAAYWALGTTPAAQHWGGISKSIGRYWSEEGGNIHKKSKSQETGEATLDAMCFESVAELLGKIHGPPLYHFCQHFL